jgi:hypothetical protein
MEVTTASELIPGDQLCCGECHEWGDRYSVLKGNLRMCGKYNRITASDENCEIIAKLDEAKGVS